ncbi:MAG TPA: NPCBM/NEW2 domain-containing protein [Anaerohalosphaeraceae bacterium]|mgnify:FL=1|nr:NPCBM/NEW2 domain-containing protein [Anaerohalosphaeraceae bacterium]
MNPSDSLKPYRKYELLLRLIEGDLNDAGLAELERWFQTSGAAEDYWEFIKNYTAVKIYEESRLDSADSAGSADSLLNADLWQALAEDEQTAPEVPVVKETFDPVSAPSKEIQKTRPRVSKLSIYTLILSTAAILMVVVYAHLVAFRRGVEVATLEDSIQAKWGEADGALKAGTRLATRRNHYLRGGVASLKFDNNASVTVEGPAEFEIVSEDRIRMQYGRLYCIVPQEALGFSVVTPTVMVVDLGTEFGVQSDFNGTTELHVSRGLTRLLAGDKQRKVSVEAKEGMGWRVSGLTSEVQEIPLAESLFVRQINSKANVVWRGQKALSLADIVGGGNGWGTGAPEIGIDPRSGKRGEIRGEDREGSREYRSLAGERYIDGVFVPEGSRPQVVSSQGHIFQECPPTNNVFFAEIVNGAARDLTTAIYRQATCRIGGREFGTADYPGLFMHANLGITFDLKAIRRDLPTGFRFTHFAAEAGLSSDIDRTPNAEVWVLVDGQVRFHTRLQDKSQCVPIRIELKETERFLTLVTTDGGDVDHPGQPGMRATDSDWCVFGNPRLEM